MGNFILPLKRKLIASGICAGFLLLSACLVAPPTPVTVVFMLDSSASAAKYRSQAIDTVKQMTKRLESQRDKVVIYKLGEEVYHLYSGEPKRQKLTEIMDAYAQSRPSERGTAYGQALQRGLEEMKTASELKHKSALIFLGDGADEEVKTGGNLDDKALATLYQSYPTDALLSFVYIEPKNGDRFRRSLHPVLKDHLLIISPVEAEEKKALQSFYKWLGR